MAWSSPLANSAVGDVLQLLGQRIAANPLQATQPLCQDRLRLVPAQGQWFAAWPQALDASPVAPGTAAPVQPVPVAIDDAEAWRLLALSGGAPMQLFGEWEPGPAVGRWRLLSAWQAREGETAQQCIWQNQGDPV